jgi:hypothetical protein
VPGGAGHAPQIQLHAPHVRGAPPARALRLPLTLPHADR